MHYDHGMHCLFEIRTGQGTGCPNEPVVNFDYCVKHLNTPRGAQHMLDRVRSEQVVTQGDVERTIQAKTQIQTKDYQTTALEKMNEALDRVLEWEQAVATLVSRIDPEDWRYTDRSGAEQVRSEVTLYERAQDRTTRVLAQVSKMAIQDKLVRLGKAQTELIIRIIMNTMTELGLNEQQFDEAKRIIMTQLSKEANLSSRTKDEVHRELTSVEAEVV